MKAVDSMRSIFGRRKRREQRIADLARNVDAVLDELVAADWMARRFAMAGDAGPALRVAISPDERTAFVVAVSADVSPAVLERTRAVAAEVTRRRRRTAGALGVIVTQSWPQGTASEVRDGVLLTSCAELAETLRFEAARLGSGL